MTPDPSANLDDLNDLVDLKQQHFADLIRMAQLVFDPSGGLPGSRMQVDWEDLFGIPPNVVENLRLLGAQYQYEMPHIAPELIWRHLDLETRQWFITHKNMLWRFEEAFPARDED